MSSYIYTRRDAIPYQQSSTALETPALLRAGGHVWEQFYPRWIMIRIYQGEKRCKQQPQTGNS